MNQFCKVFFSVFFAVLIALMLVLSWGLVHSVHTLSESRDMVYTAQLAQPAVAETLQIG